MSNALMAWLREPDHVDRADEAWMLGWIDRRPISDAVDFFATRAPKEKIMPKVSDDIAEAATEHMGEIWVVNADLTAETTALVADLFAWCRSRLDAGSRPIPIQQALEIASTAMGDPDGVGIRKPQ